MKYDELLQLVSTSDHGDWYFVAGLTDRWIFGLKENVSVQLQMMLGEASLHTAEFVAPWANAFANPDARVYWADLYYQSVPVKRFPLVFVDGGKAGLPMPVDETTEVEHLDYCVAQVFDADRQLDTYMAQAGLTVRKP